jgi:hypothetical protein
MTITNFEEYISDSILSRGYKYFTQNRVENLEEVEPDTWIAEVQGTDIYNVTIELDGNEISDWQCDCPFEGEICKHVTAVLYELTDDNKGKGEKTKQKKAPKKGNEIEIIFSKVSTEDLRNFLTNQFAYHSGLKNSFVAYFAEYLEENVENKYRLIVQSFYKAAKGRYGFVDYDSALRLSGSLSQLLDKAYDLLENRKLPECITICKVLLEEVPIFLQSTDDSSGSVSGILDSVFDLFNEIIKKSPPELKDEQFGYFLKEYPKKKYHDFGFDHEVLVLIPELISLEEQEKKFFELIDSQIEINKTDTHFDYGITSLLEAKIEYLLKNKRDEEAWSIVKDNKHYDKFMKMLIERDIKNKNYDSAIKLCNEALSRADKDGYYRSSTTWKEILLDIYEKKKDIKNIRKFAEELFLLSREIDYYKKLRSTFNTEEWKATCEKIIDKIKGNTQKGDFYDATLLADIFIIESYKERLLTLLEINSTKIEFVDKYSNCLKDDYPEKMVLFYQSAIKQYAVNTGREFYYDIVKYLKNLKRISGGEEKVKELVTSFRTQYKNRRAMMEILNKSFS